MHFIPTEIHCKRDSATLQCRLQVVIIITNRDVLSRSKLLFVLLDEGLINLDFWLLCILPNKLQICLIGQTPSQPQKGLLKIVIASGTEIVVLEISLAVELE